LAAVVGPAATGPIANVVRPQAEKDIFTIDSDVLIDLMERYEPPRPINQGK
jgi:hypothetical protein